jgi:hypothetical protein
VPVIALAVCMLMLAPCQLPAKSTHHRSTYCTTCERNSQGKIKRSARRGFLKSKGLTHTTEGLPGRPHQSRSPRAGRIRPATCSYSAVMR